MEKIKKWANNILEKEGSLFVWAATFLSCVEIRLFLDKFVAKTTSPLFDPIMDLHNVLFFGISFLLVWLVLSWVLRVKPSRLLNLMTLVNIFVIFPAVFDLLKTGGTVFWSFYLINSPRELLFEFVSFFGNLPSGIIYFGTRIVFFMVVALAFGLVLLRTKSLWKSVGATIGTYLALFFMASFPSLFAFLWYFSTGSGDISEIKPFQIIQVFTQSDFFGQTIDFRYALAYDLNLVYFLFLIFILLPIFFWFYDKAKMRAVFGNSRLVQMIYHEGLLFIGLGLGYLAYPERFTFELFSIFSVLVLFSSVFLAWEASVIFNDLSDFEIDKISNPERPLQKGIFSRKEYAGLGKIYFALSLLGALIVGVDFALLLIIYQALAFAYSSFPFRFKRFPILATFVGALASIMILFLGFALFSGENKLEGLSFRIVILLLTTYTLCLPIKDFKDIEGDKKDRVWTIPVIFGKEKGRLFVGGGFFLSYMLSVFLLNELSLFYYALLFGGISFLVITNKKIKPRSLLGINLAIVFVYGLILVKIVFLS